MAKDKANPFAPILLLVDSSETAVRAARRAVELAAMTSCKIYAVTVVDTETLSQLLKGKILVQDEMEGFEHDLTESSRRYLRMAGKVAQDAGVELEERLLKGGCHQTVLAQQRFLELRAAVEIDVAGHGHDGGLAVPSNAPDRRGRTTHWLSPSLGRGSRLLSTSSVPPPSAGRYSTLSMHSFMM